MRKICPYCKTEYAPDSAEQQVLDDDIRTVYNGKGCNFCKNTGYKGRIAIHEMLVTNRDIRRMITEGASVDQISDYARNRQGMQDLKASTLALVRDGITTVDELLKVAYTVE